MTSSRERCGMTPDLLLPLAGLALVDSTSFGTLLIPLWLMLAPGRLRATRVLAFLGTVGAYYLVLGLALLAGADRLATALDDVLRTPAAAWAQLALGVALFALSFRIGRAPQRSDDAVPSVGAVPSATVPSGPVSSEAVPPTADDDGAAAVASAVRPGRAARWRARAMGGDGSSVRALVALALAAAAAETATMLPYLSAIGLLTASDLEPANAALVLVGYCGLMLAPAVAILGARLLADARVRPALARLEAWMSRHAASTTSWVVGIVGFLLARDALTRTGVLDLLAR